MKLTTYNKALYAGGGGLFFGMLVPWVLQLLHWMQPVAAGINPVLGVVIGVLVAVVTLASPKNTPKSSS